MLKQTFSFGVDRLPSKQSFQYGNGHGYTPSRTKWNTELVQLAAIMQCYQTGDYQGEVWETIQITRQLPKSAPKKKAYCADLGTPDVDNVTKLINDALQGVLFANDKQVTRSLVIFNRRPPYGTQKANVIVKVTVWNVDDNKVDWKVAND